ncbi:MAG: NUDIX domain-containing protein [Patescibacteria group bacterium]
MRKAVRAIVIKDGNLLIMRRNKFGKAYETLPGGSVDAGESLAAALNRELMEETTIAVDNPRLVFIDHAGEPYGDQYVFLCEYNSGEPHLHPQSTELKIHQEGMNLYVPGWLPLKHLAASPFVSNKLKDNLLRALSQGWPVIPEEF